MASNNQDGLLGDERGAIPALPKTLNEFVAVDKINRKIYTDAGRWGHPLFATWFDSCRRIDPEWTVENVGLDVIAEMKSRGMNMAANDADEGFSGLHVREAALELLQAGANYRASDIHILMRGTHAEIQFRVKGGLRVYSRPAQEEAEDIVRALYQGIAAIKHSYHELKFQNAQLSGDEISAMGMTSCRMIRGPSFPVGEGGGFAIIRLQFQPDFKPPKGTLKPLDVPRKPAGELNLVKRGFTEKQVDLLMKMAEMPMGMIIFTGPTGSGKTTTLAEMMTHVARQWPQKRQITAEDPIEYPYPWAIQMQVDGSSSGDGFAERMRSGLRMDPDIALLGELRGADSAKTAIEAAMTGHQVWTTVHTNDPFQTIDRLERMDPVDLNRRGLCDHKLIRGLIAQRIVPVLCPECSVPLSEVNKGAIPTHMMEALETYGPLDNVRLRGAGCSHCDGDAVVGNEAVAEVVLTNARLMRDFVQEGTDIARRNHRRREDTDDSLMTNAVVKCLAGRFDPRDIVEKVDAIVAKGEEDE